MAIYGRTDLAEEARRLREEDPGTLGALSGVRADTESVEGHSVTCVEILSPAGEEALHMPQGRYYSLPLPASCPHRSPEFPSLVAALAALIRRCLPADRPGSALVAALGNPDVTPDAVGPLTAQSVLVSRHLVRDPLFRSLCPTALCRTGVLAMTGMESAFQIRTLCSALHPDCVVVVDALAGSDPGGLCRSVQVSDAGIAPGSGVGNDREAIDRQLLGVPVVSVGVPTVTDASSLVQGSGLDTLFVTPRYIDSSVRQLGRLLGYGINAALTPGLSVEDMELLLD